ncbi:MAG: FAD-dependent oxidoreductase [Anaerovoracaceae bacterium]
MIYADVAVIGGGPAGMSAAVAAKEAGAGKVMLIERDHMLGGILLQCIHNGFGLHKFKEELTGPEYAARYRTLTEKSAITVFTDTMVTGISEEKTITCVNSADGCFQIRAGALILAMGCRERPRGALMTPGDRPAGVMTAGTAQKFVNIKGFMPGKRIVILGSGDIGLIMARRMTLEGASVEAVCEIMEDSGGLTRNISQCLRDFNIPLKLSHTVTQIHGKERLKGVTVAKVDQDKKPINGTEEYIPCDTLMLSVGLIPENELSKMAGIKIDTRTKGPVVDENRQTSVPGIFACGNVVKVHELVDYVSDEGETAGRAAAAYAMGMQQPEHTHGKGNIPSEKKGVKNMPPDDGCHVICTVCPVGCTVKVTKCAEEYETEGNRCIRGKKHAIQEMICPCRVLTTTMRTEKGDMVPVRTDRPVPKDRIFDCMKELDKKTLLLPIALGDIIIKGIGGTDANLVCAGTISKK